ncbi:MAG TPA: OST-HTH/LOTUS domain-containing protein, partial [Planctomycetota bacterium]|nr:OST-HTH/LOTUS domain-containing protein [Planctomycetota bacterium]
VKNSSSALLIENCDEFIYYEDIVREKTAPQQGKLRDMPKKQKEAFERILDALQALVRENKDVIWGSMIKQTIKRKHPQFNEEYYGYRSFSQILEDAEQRKLLTLKKDQRSGSYIVMPAE